MNDSDKASDLAYLAGVERGWKVDLSRLAEFFPNSILREAQECAIDICYNMFLYINFYIGARDTLVTFDDTCPTSSAAKRA